nr:MAG TPA: Ogr/Delta-like zinc finger protein [Caudoviricetes sp.]
MQCTNDLCGWTGAGTFEITNTISPPSKQFNRPTLPPAADDALLDSLQASDSLI